MGMNSPLIQQAMENELPKIDLPEDLITGRLTDTTILNLYAHFPCRIKAEIFVLCRKGEVDASINLKHYHVSDSCFLTLLPGTVFQINRIEGDVDIYFGLYNQYHYNQKQLKAYQYHNYILNHPKTL